ncbi:MAG: hypothetical protein B6242_06595 [Anaerolineaceae bacterium 4572_78]|nr:MAG: hypothetical protein B6242_06595 [Anaerolineaceae bacterium 4572_78]
MTYKGHFLMGAGTSVAMFTVGYLLNANGIPYTLFVSVPFVMLGSILPDIDNENSRISHRLPTISKTIRSVTTHRGITHWIDWGILFIAMGIGISLLGGLFGLYGMWIFVGLGLGHLTHLLGDSMTRAGIPKGILFRWLNRRKRLWLFPYSMKTLSLTTGFKPSIAEWLYAALWTGAWALLATMVMVYG